MADFGLQLESLSQGLEQHGPWHFRDVRFQQDARVELEAALLQTAVIPRLSDRLLEFSKASRPERQGPARSDLSCLVSELPSHLTPPEGCSGPGSPGAVSPTGPRPELCLSLFPPTLPPSLVFKQIAPAGNGREVVAFPLPQPHPPSRPCLKRRRPATDVDGPNSSSLGCKKRRLLRNFVTSRLSQPFSLPATHILNRESAAGGDKRFLKLAAIMSARRLNSAVVAAQSNPAVPPQPSPSTWLRRAAVLNSLRRRVCAEVAERAAAGSGGNPPVSDVAARAAMFQQGQGATAFVGRYLVSASSTPSSSPSKPRPAPHASPIAAIVVTTTPGSRTPAPQRPLNMPCPATMAPSSPNAATTQRTTTSFTATTSIRPTSPATPATTTTTTCLRIPSPKLRPLRSPELRVTRPLVPLEDIEDLLYNNNSSSSGSSSNVASGSGSSGFGRGNEPGDIEGDGDPDGVAFPTSEHESRYEDEPEEVYADFSVIFGGGGGDGGGSGSGVGDDLDDDAAAAGGLAGDHFEDYMDDLDGIPWIARC